MTQTHQYLPNPCCTYKIEIKYAHNIVPVAITVIAYAQGLIFTYYVDGKQLFSFSVMVEVHNVHIHSLH